MKAHHQIKQLLDEHGAVLVRQKKHLIYKFPNGRVISIAKTASDHRATANALSDIKRITSQ